MRCYECKHNRDAHEHYRAGSECSMRLPGGAWCRCHAFEHPLRGAVWGALVWVAHRAQRRRTGV